jgi:hypothetical protein
MTLPEIKHQAQTLLPVRSDHPTPPLLEILPSPTGARLTTAIRHSFRQFQYPTVPLHVSDDYMNTMLRKALAPALDPGKDR